MLCCGLARLLLLVYLCCFFLFSLFYCVFVITLILMSSGGGVVMVSPVGLCLCSLGWVHSAVGLVLRVSCGFASGLFVGLMFVFVGAWGCVR